MSFKPLILKIQFMKTHLALCELRIPGRVSAKRNEYEYQKLMTKRSMGQIYCNSSGFPKPSEICPSSHFSERGTVQANPSPTRQQPALFSPTSHSRSEPKWQCVLHASWREDWSHIYVPMVPQTQTQLREATE